MIAGLSKPSTLERPSSEHATMSLRGSMMEFTREGAIWLFSQDFWLEMSSSEKMSWLEFRERVTMQYEDILHLRDMEQCQMAQQDVVEMSRLHFDPDLVEEFVSLEEYQHAWRILGGGPNVAVRLNVTHAPRTPPPKRRSTSSSPHSHTAWMPVAHLQSPPSSGPGSHSILTTPDTPVPTAPLPGSSSHW